MNGGGWNAPSFIDDQLGVVAGRCGTCPAAGNGELLLAYVFFVYVSVMFKWSCVPIAT